MTVDELIGYIQSSMVVGPDGDRAIAPSGEAYKMFSFSTPRGTGLEVWFENKDAQLCAALYGALVEYKRETGGKYLRWRVRPEIKHDNDTASIRCRVLISKDKESVAEIIREEETLWNSEPEPRVFVPVPEPCCNVYLITPGFKGHSGKFYDEYGVPLNRLPYATWERP